MLRHSLLGSRAVSPVSIFSHARQRVGLSLLACMASACQLVVGGSGLLELDSVDSSVRALDDAGSAENDATLPAPDARPPVAQPSTDAQVSEEEMPCIEPSLWYADEDDDGYGDSRRPMRACGTPAKAARQAGDCVDLDARVHPQQESYFGEPHLRDDGSESCDYACSGPEEGMQGVPVAPGSCGWLSRALCWGCG